jgi:hypothetical protein
VAWDPVTRSSAPHPSGHSFRGRKLGLYRERRIGMVSSWWVTCMLGIQSSPFGRHGMFQAGFIGKRRALSHGQSSKQQRSSTTMCEADFKKTRVIAVSFLSVGLSSAVDDTARAGAARKCGGLLKR